MSTTINANSLLIQRDALRDALAKVLDTRAQVAISETSHRIALQHYSPAGRATATREFGRAVDAANAAEREARVLLLTLKD